MTLVKSTLSEMQNTVQKSRKKLTLDQMSEDQIKDEIVKLFLEPDDFDLYLQQQTNAN